MKNNHIFASFKNSRLFFCLIYLASAANLLMLTFYSITAWPHGERPSSCHEHLNPHEMRHESGNVYTTIVSPEGGSFNVVVFLIQHTPISVLESLQTPPPLNSKHQALLNNLMSRGSQEVPWPNLGLNYPMQAINCHGFTFMNSHISFLEPGYWVNPSASNEYTFGFNPMVEILKSYFYQVEEQTFSDLNPTIHLKVAKQKDVLVFMDADNNILHSGILVNGSGDQNKALKLYHKLGVGPVLLSPLEHLRDIYPFTKIVVWRRVADAFQ